MLLYLIGFFLVKAMVPKLTCAKWARSGLCKSSSRIWGRSEIKMFASYDIRMRPYFMSISWIPPSEFRHPSIVAQQEIILVVWWRRSKCSKILPKDHTLNPDTSGALFSPYCHIVYLCLFMINIYWVRICSIEFR